MRSVFRSEATVAVRRRAGPSALWLLALLLLSSLIGLACRPREPRGDLPRYIAHALGGIDGHTLTNSLEAWETNYSRGCRVFEVDLSLTIDGKLVALHSPDVADPALPRDFTHADFLSKKIFGKYTPLDSDGLARLLAETPDWTIVTDTKSDFRRSLEILCDSLRKRGVACRDRVIPQIYRPAGELALVEEMGFRKVIFTIYRTAMRDEEILRTARASRRIVAVTMPPARATEEMVRSLKSAGLLCYVHTVNGHDAIQQVFQRRIWGVYTDWGCGGGVSPVVETPFAADPRGSDPVTLPPTGR